MGSPVSENAGILYIVATPIGNLSDISERAIQVLTEVDVIAAEDTRHTRQLLSHFAIRQTLISVHEHNETQQLDHLLTRLADGESIALVSDAGTPLISDPGYVLVKAAREKGISVSPIPGPCALIAALSVSGLPTDHFRFEGFLPHKRSARQVLLQSVSEETVTMVFYESSHRIKETLEDMCTCLGADREAVLGRELTKLYETVLGSTLRQILDAVEADDNQRRGEFVLMVHGADASQRSEIQDADPLLKLLLSELPMRKASGVAAKYLGLSKNDVYKRAMVLKGDAEE